MAKCDIAADGEHVLDIDGPFGPECGYCSRPMTAKGIILGEWLITFRTNGGSTITGTLFAESKLHALLKTAKQYSLKDYRKVACIPFTEN